MEWIKLTERKPKQNKECLLAINDGNKYITVGEYRENDTFIMLIGVGAIEPFMDIKSKYVIAWAEYPKYSFFS